MSKVWVYGVFAFAAALAHAEGADLSEYQSVETARYIDAHGRFEIEYPYLWEKGESPLGKAVVYVSGTYRQPSLSVDVRERPAELSLEQSIGAITTGFPGGPRPTRIKQLEVEGHPAAEARVSWVYPIYEGFEIETRIVSIFVGDAWYVLLGSDIKTEEGFSPDLVAAQNSLRLGKE